MPMTPLPTTGSAELVAAYDAATDRLARYHVDIVDQSAQLAAVGKAPLNVRS